MLRDLLALIGSHYQHGILMVDFFSQVFLPHDREGNPRLFKRF